jgi:hypothetical protein
LIEEFEETKITFVGIEEYAKSKIDLVLFKNLKNPKLI